MSEELLLEIGAEEIPDWMIPAALKDLERRFLEALEGHGLRAGASVATEGTPRRLVLIAQGLVTRQADREELLKGPPRNIAFGPNGKPTKAAEGFARRAGVAVEELETGDDGRLEVKRQIEGRPTVEILAEMLPEVILGIHFPKNMYWTGKGGPLFIRPIRRLVALLGGRVVAFSIAGVASGDRTMGHRRLGSADIAVTGAGDYREKLRKNFVLLAAAERREKIQKEAAALLPAGTRLRLNPRLLETLVYITEYPTPILGGFDPDFLSLPEEVLETVMQHHQKYFAVEDSNGRIEPRFVAVANLDGDPEGIIRRGHERVLRARFNDARFFWEADQKKRLAERLADLRQVTYQAKLGSYAAKTERNQDLAVKLAAEIGLPPALSVKVARGAELAKCDLTTEMVKEFPELQGIIGGLYARYQGEDADVADAIYDHYRPAGADDAIPRGVVGQMVALADKLDTLGGLFRLGMIPSGSKDPFALRRAAYGIIRILIEGGQRLTLDQLCRLAGADDNSDALREFFVDRLRHYLREVRGYQYDEVQAVLSASDQEPLDVAARAEAIAQVRPTPDFVPLAVSCKRIKNILRQAGGVEKYARLTVDRARLEAGAESDLYSAFEELRPRVASLKEQGDYAAALAAIASLRPAVDTFFDKVLVMAQDEQIRDNRLAFLAHLLEEFSTIADFAEIVSA